MPTITNDTDKLISTLNSFLRGEMSAVETYSQAIQHLDGDPTSTLKENRDCHARRVNFIRGKVIAAGGEPSTSSGAWGNFTSAIEKGASLLGKKMVYAALEEGEDRGLAMYRSPKDADDTTLEMIRVHLLPTQQATHDRMKVLKNAV